MGWSLGPYLPQLSSAVHRAPLEVEMKERQRERERERERERCFKKEKNILASPGELAHTPTPGTG